MASEQVQINANIKNEETGVTLKRTATVDFDFGATLEESVEMYGAETVHRLFVQKARISIQDAGRAVLSDESKSEEDVAKAIEDFSFEGTGRKRQNKVEKVSKLFDELSDEQKQAIIAKLMGNQGDAG